MKRTGTKGAADYLGVPESTLRAWRHSGRAGDQPAPPSYKIGRHVKYDIDELDAWVEQIKKSERATA